MNDQIILTGNDAKRYQLFQASIKDIVEDRGLSEELRPMIKTPFELFANLHALWACVRDTAMWLGVVPGYSSNVDIDKAKREIQSAYFSYTSASDTLDWVFHMKVIAELIEVVQCYTEDKFEK